MVATWAVEEMAGVDLDDARLNERVCRMLSDLGSRPTASIPAACGGRSEMEAAYRFFDNDKALPEKILEPHVARTRERAAAQKVVLCVQDTTEIDLTRPQMEVAGAGPLATDARQGCFLHLLEAFTPDGTPLGQVWSTTWARSGDSIKVPKVERDKRRKLLPIEDKESFRWLEGLRQTRALAEACPDTACVCVADSEGDIYELFSEPRGEKNPAHFLIRLGQDRALEQDENDDGAAESRLIQDRVRQAPVLFTAPVSVRAREPKVNCEDRHTRRQPRQSRETTVEVRAASMTLRPPWRPDRKLPEVAVNVVWVREVDPPADDEPVEWILVTTLPIDTVEQVREIIEYYRVRWMIEIVFRTLKSGCRIEARRFERLDRLETCLAVYLIVTWRTLFVCRLARSADDLDCEVVFEPSEWKSVWMAVHRKRPPKKPPTLNEIVRLIAQLGGYVNRPNRKDPPGPQTVWLGLQRMRDLACAWETFGPGAG
jgi:hypothetical protein